MCRLGAVVTANAMGSKGRPAPRATEGIPVLLVMDTAIKGVAAALERSGGWDGDIVRGKQHFQGYFLPEDIL